MPDLLHGNTKLTHCLLLLCPLALSGCGDSPSPDDARPVVAVANSYLEAAVAQFSSDLRIIRLAEPGTCPGHFDLRPQQLREIRGARALLRFDFQRGLEERLRSAHDATVVFGTITIPGGMCEPDSFAAVSRQVADTLQRAGLLTADHAAARLRHLEERLVELTTWAREELQRAGLSSTPIVTSYHQAAFCEYLGLTVSARFRGAESAGIDEIEAILQRGPPVQIVIANRPEGVRLAESLAIRLGVPVVVFDNFPADTPTPGTGFEQLVRANVERLLTATTTERS